MFVGETPLSNSPFSVFAQPFELHDAQVTPAKAAIHAGLRDHVENAFRGPGIGDRAIGPICALGKCLVDRQTGKRVVDDQLGICDPYVVHHAVAVVEHQATLCPWLHHPAELHQDLLRVRGVVKHPAALDPVD